MRAFILFLSLMLGQMATAQTLEENVRAALLAGDADQLETLIDAAQTEALATGSHEELRHVYRRIFATTHPGYEATIRDWVATHPDSAYAWTALGDMQFWQALAFQVSYAYHPGGPKPLGDGVQALLPQAQLSALRAHDLDPAFVRASVLAFKTYQYGQHNFLPDDIAAETLSVAPDYRVVVEAATSTQGLYGGDFATAFAICHKYAPHVADYTADECAIEVALTTNTDSGAQQAARAALKDDPSPRFDGLRVAAARSEPIDRGLVPQLILIHKAQLTEVSDLQVWATTGQSLGYSADNLFFVQEARQLAVDEARKRLQDDPRNPWLALMLIENSRYDPNLPAELPPPEPSTERFQALHAIRKELWRAALPFGYQSGAFWRVGVSADVDLLLDKPAGAIAAIPYIENALVLSEHDAGTITSAFMDYVWAIYDGSNYDTPTGIPTLYSRNPVVIPEEVRCTLGRLTRMMEFVCQGNQADQRLCPNYRPGPEIADVLLKLQEEPAFCPSVAAMSPSALAYTELRPIPGFDPATYEGPAAAP
jgi:hypothetical protein